MKSVKLLLAVVLSLVALGASAQFSVKAGYANSILKGKSGGDSDITSMNGFRVGAAYDITLSANGLSIRPGLNYTLGTYKETSDFFIRKTTLTEHSMSLPVDVKYEFKVNDSFRIYAFAGPGFSVGLAMPVKYEFSGDLEHINTLGIIDGYISRDGYSGKSKSDLSEEVLSNELFSEFMHQGRIPRFDVTIGLGAGMQYKRAFLEFDYDFGLLNRMPSGVTGKGRRDELAVSLGVVF